MSCHVQSFYLHIFLCASVIFSESANYSKHTTQIQIHIQVCNEHWNLVSTFESLQTYTTFLALISILLMVRGEDAADTRCPIKKMRWLSEPHRWKQWWERTGLSLTTLQIYLHNASREKSVMLFIKFITILVGSALLNVFFTFLLQMQKRSQESCPSTRSTWLLTRKAIFLPLHLFPSAPTKGRAASLEGNYLRWTTWQYVTSSSQPFSKDSSATHLTLQYWKGN